MTRSVLPENVTQLKLTHLSTNLGNHSFQNNMKVRRGFGGIRQAAFGSKFAGSLFNCFGNGIHLVSKVGGVFFLLPAAGGCRDLRLAGTDPIPVILTWRRAGRVLEIKLRN